MLRPFYQILAFEVFAFFHSDKSLGSLAPVRIRDGDHSSFEDIWVLDQHRLKGDRGNILATFMISAHGNQGYRTT
jgi:hypothetical protein